MTEYNEQQYLEECTKYFAPLDEICEAIRNKEGLQGLTYDNVVMIVCSNQELFNAVTLEENL